MIHTATLPSPVESSLASPQHHCHSHTRSNSCESLLFTPPLSPTEEQLLAFLIPDIEPSELAAYLSAPTTPALSDVSCLVAKSVASTTSSSDRVAGISRAPVEVVYPSPVCAAAAAAVVALDCLDAHPLSFDATSTEMPPTPDQSFGQDFSRFGGSSLHRKRCSSYAFSSAEDDDSDNIHDLSEYSSQVFVMSSRHPRKRLMLEQPFTIPDDNDVFGFQDNLVQSSLENKIGELDVTTDLSNTLAFDLVLV
ncbi:hypothetical protein BGW38_009858 [Lunasporangiospora selenospora]|uniref:Uncharacterized protein n=1 Tax=Lunasporangiospora selenospora TaxID=979761 RepID=A0A9P6FXD1_9FUNG|nr:hypothetical protein BGW38_009858 [Lunasporangiospora selenospora]